MMNNANFKALLILNKLCNNYLKIFYSTKTFMFLFVEEYRLFFMQIKINDKTKI
jgi:hypothetical protein